MATKVLKLTKELKEKLMGYSVATGSLEYSPKMDIPEEFIPIFNVRNLSNKEYNELKQIQNIKDESKMETKMLGLVKNCIVGWSNFIDLSNETYIEFESDDNGCVIEKLFTLLPLGIKLDMFKFIMKINGIG